MKRKNYYAVHRWLGVLVGVQLLLWSSGGLIFSTHDIDWVRGMEGKSCGSDACARSLPLDQLTVSPQAAAQTAGVKEVVRIETRWMLDAPIYEITGRSKSALVNATTGRVLSPISEDMAKAIAKKDRAQKTTVKQSALITEDPPVEYREKPLPAWQIALDDADNTHIYVAAGTGRITARRNDAWRRFDFFWMLHTMDYSGRDDFNTPWLIIFASLGVLSTLSGGALWGLRIFKGRAKAG
jgi:uncharacterized iron-regulated membrane protein